jgi:hypothetical protein
VSLRYSERVTPSPRDLASSVTIPFSMTAQRLHRVRPHAMKDVRTASIRRPQTGLAELAMIAG